MRLGQIGQIEENPRSLLKCVIGYSLLEHINFSADIFTIISSGSKDLTLKPYTVSVRSVWISAAKLIMLLNISDNRVCFDMSVRKQLTESGYKGTSRYVMNHCIDTSNFFLIYFSHITSPYSSCNTRIIA